MRVLLWSQYFWPEIFRINDLAAALVKSGLSVTVLTGKPNYPEGRFYPGYRAAGFTREIFSGADVVRIPMLRRGMGSVIRLGLNYLSFIVSGYLFAPFALWGREYDVVFVYAPSPLLQALPALFLSRIKRAPTVVWVQDLWPEALSATGYVRNPIALRLVETLVRHIYERADSILIQSESFRAPVARLTRDATKIRFFPNFAETPDPTEPGSEEAHRLADAMREHFAVVFAGNVGQAQSVDTIIEAAEQLRDVTGVRIYIVGAGSRIAWVAEEIQQRKLENVILAGRFPATDMPVILAAASVFLATLGDDPVGAYTIPSKLQTYLAAGRPVIASMNGEGARIVTQANAGIACPASDAPALAAAVLTLWSMSNEARAQLGENGKHYFTDNFEVTRLTDELIAHLAQCRQMKRRSKG